LLTEELILNIPENLKSLKQIIIHRPLDIVNEAVEPLPLDVPFFAEEMMDLP